MTNEEAIEVFKNDIEICTIQQKQACDMAIKALEQTRWIPVSERLPEDESKLFIVTVNINNVKYVYHELVGCDGETWHIGGMGEELPFDVVAYMPLPQPYTGSEDEE